MSMLATYHFAMCIVSPFSRPCCTFLLLIAGALVTSNDAGLSVPDWPLSYGSLLPPMVGGIFYEHGHRMIATLVGILSIVLAVWLWRVESRRWVRWLGVAALGAVVAQGILGGITVLFFLPAPVSAAHATLAQLFFCTIVSIALFTSAWWKREQPQFSDSGSPSVHSLAIGTACATLVQFMLGAAFRHKAFGIIPHLIGAVVVTGMIFWFAGVLRRRFSDVPALRNSARLLHGLIGLQLLLGAGAWWSRVYGAQFPAADSGDGHLHCDSRRHRRACPGHERLGHASVLPLGAPGWCPLTVFTAAASASAAQSQHQGAL